MQRHRIRFLDKDCLMLLQTLPIRHSEQIMALSSEQKIVWRNENAYIKTCPLTSFQIEAGWI